MDAQQFSTPQEFAAHLKETQGERYHDVVLTAAQIKSTRSLAKETYDKSQPGRAMLTDMALGMTMTNALVLLIKFAGLENRVDDIKTDADSLVVLGHQTAAAMMQADTSNPQ